MQYAVGNLYQRSDDGRSWANGLGPLQENLVIASTHSTRAAAIAAGVRLIGSPSPMGVYEDAYLIRQTAEHGTVLGEIHRGGNLNPGFSRPPTRTLAAPPSL